MAKIFIPIGESCFISGNLRHVKLQNTSLPFDWLLYRTPIRGIEYLNDLINTRFSNFTTDLTYNTRGKVISKFYPYVEFYHYDLIKNTVLNRPHDSTKDLIEMMRRRAERFMSIIDDASNRVLFMYSISKDSLMQDSEKLYQDIITLCNNIYIKCGFNIVVIVYNNDTEFVLDLPDKFKSIDRCRFVKYIKNTQRYGVYGERADFKKLMDELEI